MNDGGWTEANVVAAAVRILGGAQKVADSLGVSRSQVYRWIKARTMERATYLHVAKLASLSGIDTGFLGGSGSVSSPLLSREAQGKRATAAPKIALAQASRPNLKQRVGTYRQEGKLVASRQSLNGAAKMNWKEADHEISTEELIRTEAQKGGTEQTCVTQSNGVAPSSGDHYGRRKTLRTKGQEESREHQP